MNPVNRAQVKAFSEAFDFGEKSESDQFELYSIYAILNGGSGESVDPFEAHLLGNEFGLDGVAIIVQGNLVTNPDEAATALEGIRNPQINFYFIQSKTSASFDYGNAAKFFDGVKGFFEDTMVGESPQLDDLIAAKDYLYENGVKRKNPRLYCHYVSTGNYESQPRIERLIENTKNELSEMSIFEDNQVEIEMVGAAQLQRLYRAAATASEVKVEFQNNIVLPDHDSVEEGFIGYLPATELLKIVTSYDEDGEITGINKSVFYDNIRDYNPNSKINKEIIQNLKNGEYDNFVYRNNGITVVAKSVDRTGNNFTIEDFQVVNGCQTSSVIFHNREHIDGVQVPFRLIGTKDEDFIFSIISGTNKQNPVKEEQFWSLLPFMKNLEEYSRGLPMDDRIYLERRENQYRLENIERARIVQMQPFFKVINSTLLGAPQRAARNYKEEIRNNVDAIFNEKNDVRPAYAAAYLHYRLEFLWRNQKIPADTKIYRYHIMSAITRSILGSKKFSGLKDKQKIEFAKKLIQVASDENQMVEIVKNVSKIVGKKLKSMGLAETREKLRDNIRSESFFKVVEREYTPDKGSL